MQGLTKECRVSFYLIFCSEQLIILFGRICISTFKNGSFRCADSINFSGRFRLLPCRNVLEMIDRLMDMRLILKVQSGFSRQFVLTITKDGENFLELPFRQLHTKFCEFNDSEWCEFIKEHDYTNDRYVYSEKEKQEFLHLLEHRNVVLTQHDVWLPAFLENVDGWQEFARKQSEGAGISDKAYWRFVANIRKKGVKNAKNKKKNK